VAGDVRALKLGEGREKRARKEKENEKGRSLMHGKEFCQGVLRHLE
jgi:hypothetical protein